MRTPISTESTETLAYEIFLIEGHSSTCLSTKSLSDSLKVKLRLLLLYFLVLVLTACGGAPIKPQQSQAPAPAGSATSVSNFSVAEQRQFQLALKDIEENNLDRAASTLEDMSRKRANASSIWANLGQVYYRQNKMEPARDAIDKALLYSPESSELHNLNGLVLVAGGNVMQAEQEYLQAIKLNSTNANAHYNLALVYDIYYQEINRALQHYQKYLQLIKTEDTATSSWVAQLQRSLGNN